MPPRVLTDEEIRDALVRLPSWSGDRERLERLVTAPDFPTAIRLVTLVADAAEEINHHPDIDIRWRRVRFVLRTHVSKGVTKYDLELARRIDQAATDVGAE